ncbi:MAG: type I methionyl aminopeptidase [Patescibacteria group bacterium]|nr:type I methionyl aminopeptidase [Patescibacteria group bacterium]
MLIKTKSEIKKINEGGKILGKILEKLARACKPGVSTWQIDREAERMIKEAGGRPAFKEYKSCPTDSPFPCTICASLNSELVHGIAKKEIILKDGDIFTIDIGMEWPHKKAGFFSSSESKSRKKGFFTDTALTLAIGNIPEETKKLMRVTKNALEIGIKAARPGNSVADIGRAIEDYVAAQGKYGIVRDLVGHGVGYAVHEEPRIPNYYDKKLERFILKPGMVLAIEPMISIGSHKVKNAKDGWTIVMEDESLCAHFEHTVVITEQGCDISTRRPNEKKEKI